MPYFVAAALVAGVLANMRQNNAANAAEPVRHASSSELHGAQHQRFCVLELLLMELLLGVAAVIVGIMLACFALGAVLAVVMAISFILSLPFYAIAWLARKLFPPIPWDVAIQIRVAEREAQAALRADGC